MYQKVLKTWAAFVHLKELYSRDCILNFYSVNTVLKANRKTVRLLWDLYRIFA
jgi:hypothetical protein